jgi:hypothetical protein
MPSRCLPFGPILSRCAKGKWLRAKTLEIDYPELHWTYGLGKGMVTAL